MVYPAWAARNRCLPRFKASPQARAKNTAACLPMTVIGIISTAAWGLGYFDSCTFWRFMAAESAKSLVSARRIGMTWMALCLAGAVAVGYFGIAYFGANPDKVSSKERQPRTHLHRAFHPAVQPDRLHHFERDFGGGDVHPVLPAFGLLQRDYRRLLQRLFA